MKDIINKLDKIIGDEYGIKHPIPDELKSSINGWLQREALETKKILIIYNPMNGKPEYIKKVT